MSDRFTPTADQVRARRVADETSMREAVSDLRREAITVAIEDIRQAPTLDRDLLADILSALLKGSRV